EPPAEALRALDGQHVDALAGAQVERPERLARQAGARPYAQAEVAPRERVFLDPLVDVAASGHFGRGNLVARATQPAPHAQHVDDGHGEYGHPEGREREEAEALVADSNELGMHHEVRRG